MKRIDIHYGGDQYSVGGRDLAELQEEITGGDTPRWLKVNDGEGAPRTAYLLLAPGIPIAVVPIPDDRISAVR